MKKFISSIFWVMLMAITLVGCTQKDVKETAKIDNKLNIVATIFPQYDFTRAIVGDKANLSMLVSPGSSVHSFEPSPADIIKVKNADVFIYIGGESDAWIDNILKSIDISKKKIIRLMDYVNTVEEQTVEGMEHEKESESEGHDKKEEHEYDEHIWTSPKNAIKLIGAISDCLCEKDKTNAEFYRQNAQNYIDGIKKVDKDIASIIKNAPNKIIVVADKFPFRYFVDEYGLKYSAAFGGCSDQADASAATIAYMVDTVKKNKIPYVYYVELSNQNVAKSICEQTDSKMLLLHSCHNVSREDFDSGVTYLSLMKQNAENLRKGFGE